MSEVCWNNLTFIFTITEKIRGTWMSMEELKEELDKLRYKYKSKTLNRHD